eukprot:1191130-Prorocentrum_minimum.AAC.3
MEEGEDRPDRGLSQRHEVREEGIFPLQDPSERGKREYSRCRTQASEGRGNIPVVGPKRPKRAREEGIFPLYDTQRVRRAGAPALPAAARRAHARPRAYARTEIGYERVGSLQRQGAAKRYPNWSHVVEQWDALQAAIHSARLDSVSTGAGGRAAERPSYDAPPPTDKERQTQISPVKTRFNPEWPGEFTFNPEWPGDFWG